MSNINDNFFDGEYKEIWKTLIPGVLTVKEVDFMIPYFDLQPGTAVLDLMCGYGRHALALGRKGVQVTAVDNLADYIAEVKAISTKENLPVQAIQASVTEHQPSGQFDLAICMGNSLNFFDALDVQKILAMVASALKPGGHLLINTWSIAEIVFRNFKETSESVVGETKMNSRLEIKFQPTRSEGESTFITPDGKTETKKGIDYIYSLNEMEAMLKLAGLKLQEVYSIPGRKKFTIGEPRAYIIAVKS